MTPDQLKELDRLSERWANECPTQAEWTDVGRDVMDLLPDVLEHIKRLTTERDAALKACAEMKALANAIHDYKSTGYTGIDIDLALEVINSTDCGKGYHHDDEWKPVVEALKISDAYLSELGVGYLHLTKVKNEQALAHAEKLMEGK